MLSLGTGQELSNKENWKLAVLKVTWNKNTFQQECIKMSAFKSKNN